jgi:hypothetical protein
MTHTTLASSWIARWRRPRAVAVGVLLVFGVLVAADQTPPAQTVRVRDTSAAQQPPIGTARVSGRVLNAEAGRSIRGATVRLVSATLNVAHSVATDDAGNFQFTDLPAGPFMLSTSKVGYLDTIYGQKKLGSGRPGTPISLADGQHLERLTLPMPRGGAITGMITDDVGEPAYLTIVRAMRYVERAGERTLVLVGSAAADDRGVYRIAALAPGDYVIVATPLGDVPLASLQLAADSALAGRGSGGAWALPFASGGADQSGIRAPAPSDTAAPTVGYAPVYFPATTVSGTAAIVTLGVGDERSGIDVQLQRVPMGSITGTMSGADQKAIAGATITLIDPQALPGMAAKSARSGTDGRFSFTGVVPGSYTLSAHSGAFVSIQTDTVNGQTHGMVVFGGGAGPGGARGAGAPNGALTLQGVTSSLASSMWASADVIVDGRTPTTAALVLQPGMTINGKLAFEGSAQVPADLTQTRMLLTPASQNDRRSGSAVGSVDADGRFKITGVPPGTYKITATSAGGWHAASIEIGGRDVLDFPLEVKPNDDIGAAVVTFTDRSQSLSGTMQNASGQPTADATVIVFAEDQRYWLPQSRRIMATRPATDGTFSFASLPPGNYRLIAVSDVEQDQWFDPAFLRQLSGAATSLTLADGERKTQDIRVAK